MVNMNCKWCGIAIDYDPDSKTAKVVASGQQHECAKKPQQWKKNWTKKEFKPKEDEMVIKAIQSEIQILKETVNKHDEAIRALVKEMSFKKADGGVLQ